MYTTWVGEMETESLVPGVQTSRREWPLPSPYHELEAQPKHQHWGTDKVRKATSDLEPKLDPKSIQPQNLSSFQQATQVQSQGSS